MSTDNSFTEGKIAVREWLLEQVAEPAQVLDLYCGAEGQMYQGVWHKADSYFGVDKRAPHSLAPTCKMSAERAAGTFDLDAYNLFDLDCYDSPWKVARRIIQRRGSGTFGMALTSGEQHGLMSGKGNEIIRATLGIRNLSDTRLFGRFWEDVLLLMVRSLGEMERATLGPTLTITGKRTGYWVHYLGITIDKHPILCYTLDGDKKPYSTGGIHNASNVIRAGDDSSGNTVRGEDHL